jgi:spore germination cell wall hydrolase CwlJ-like protein
MHNDIKFVDITDGATHYHADYVKPSWAKTKVRTTEIGDHIFYRWEKK